MKPQLPVDALPAPAETIDFLRRRTPAGGGLNWGAVTAGFVCPGAGQFVSGRRTAGIFFFAIFVGASAIAFVPLLITLGSSFQVALGQAAEARPIPWLFLAVGFGLAVLTWLIGMLQAAFLPVVEEEE